MKLSNVLLYIVIFLLSVVLAFFLYQVNSVRNTANEFFAVTKSEYDRCLMGCHLHWNCRTICSFAPVDERESCKSDCELELSNCLRRCNEKYGR
ncbi:hypothetical protein Thena_0365 [Thermodesulfobium narugense DSM 14796]|uniref:Uncharacterized protein n=1 Tax=Thermodesulfobium narugense DSM 14796 TaxID=747365 RepID=M1E545_9BACT|nr:hypothetical protein [Thermodesulfobium narugense]AEE14011.1 hypothetical protein Thena_0365 [Thermodesulfobium narugense DSM 14796]